MDELVFKKEGHKYYLNGKRIPSVSDLTRFISREVYGDIDPIALDRAAERGTAVHMYTELLDEYRKVDVGNEYGGYIEAYIKFRSEHKALWQESEYKVHFADYYAGTLDRLGWVDGKYCILDIKTGKTIGKKHKTLYTAQLNLYRLAANDENLFPEKLYILHLKNNGEYKLIELKKDNEIANACITLSEALK